jgi:hypothetical protein
VKSVFRAHHQHSHSRHERRADNGEFPRLQGPTFWAPPCRSRTSDAHKTPEPLHPRSDCCRESPRTVYAAIHAVRGGSPHPTASGASGTPGRGNSDKQDERRSGVRTQNRWSQRCERPRACSSWSIEPRRCRSSEPVQGRGFTSVFVHPTRQHTNPQAVIEGPLLAGAGVHAKVRRAGYHGVQRR